MNARVGSQLLAPQPDRGEQQDHRVEGVLAGPRVARRVRLDAVNTTSTSSEASGCDLDVVAIAGVVQQRGVDAVEQPVVDHDCLAAAPLLGRRPEEDDLAGQLESATAASAIAAPTPDAAIVLWPQPWPRPGQRVVLGEDRDPRRPPAAAAGQPAPDRRLEASRPDAPPRSRVCAGPRRTQVGRLALLERRLGMRVDPVREIEELVARGVDGSGDPPLASACAGRGGSARRGGVAASRGSARWTCRISARPTGSPRRRGPWRR